MEGAFYWGSHPGGGRGGWVLECPWVMGGGGQRLHHLGNDIILDCAIVCLKVAGVTGLI